MTILYFSLRLQRKTTYGCSIFNIMKNKVTQLTKFHSKKLKTALLESNSVHVREYRLVTNTLFYLEVIKITCWNPLLVHIFVYSISPFYRQQEHRKASVHFIVEEGTWTLKTRYRQHATCPNAYLQPEKGTHLDGILNQVIPATFVCRSQTFPISISQSDFINIENIHFLQGYDF